MAWDDPKIPHVSVLTSADWHALVAFVKSIPAIINYDLLFPTVEVMGILEDAEVNHAYLCNNPGRVTITLPETATVGQKIELIGKGLGGWALEQRDGQYVRLDEESTTVGTGGRIASTARYDAMILRCTTPDVEWTAISIIGNLTVI